LLLLLLHLDDQHSVVPFQLPLLLLLLVHPCAFCHLP
jgi:hypothetical protein